MTDNALQSYENVDALRAATGEDSVNRRFTVPFIILNQTADKGTAGNFLLGDGKDEVGKALWKDLGAAIKPVILKCRMSLRSWNEGKSFYSYEFDNWDEKTTLFENRVQVAEGDYRELTQKYPDLKLHYVLYLWNEDKLQKMSIKGASLASFFRYLNSFPKGRDSFVNYVTEMTSHSDKKGAVTYFVTDFKRGEVTDKAKIGPLLIELNCSLELLRKALRDKSDNLSDIPF